MNLSKLIDIWDGLGCHKVYVKRMAANDNSKNQVYIGDSFDFLNIFPIGPITTDVEGKRKIETFKATIDFKWISIDGETHKAPRAQFILYPRYPEIRFSGFLKGCKKAPNELMTSRDENRVLFLAENSSSIFGYVTTLDSEVANEFLSLNNLEVHGVFSIITLSDHRIQYNAKDALLNELKRIHNLGWIISKRLTPNFEIVPCRSSNCGGFTLEAELNIPSNATAKPDFLGYEVKQFRVSKFSNIASTVISLMDHSPTGGFYKNNGVEAFIRKYGYNDKLGREARMNFGGVHKFGIHHHLTSLRLLIFGFDADKKVITDTNGYVALVDSNDNVAASWSFASLISHWTTKHANACYVPSMFRINNDHQEYSFGNKVILGSYTDVSLFLLKLAEGKIYFDPGIKLEFLIPGKRKQQMKVRSLFRIKSGDLSALYQKNEVIDVTTL